MLQHDLFSLLKNPHTPIKACYSINICDTPYPDQIAFHNMPASNEENPPDLAIINQRTRKGV